MYFGAKAPIFDNAASLRNHQTKAEEILWEKLKGKQICGVRFRRQHPFDIFIADFYCHAARLVVELDGEIHCSQKEYDAARTEEINNFEVEVIRFKNEEVFTQIDDVVLKITETVKIVWNSEGIFQHQCISPLGDGGRYKNYGEGKLCEGL